MTSPGPQHAASDGLRAAVEALVDDFRSEVDWSNGRSNYGDNEAWEAAANRLARALAAHPAPEPQHDAAVAAKALACHDCGLLYSDPGWCDCHIPDDTWLRISPTGHEGGVLCISCIARRLVENGIEGVPLKVTSGPWDWTERETANKGEAIMDTIQTTTVDEFPINLPLGDCGCNAAGPGRTLVQICPGHKALLLIERMTNAATDD
jgi:hypothetical protein